MINESMNAEDMIAARPVVNVFREASVEVEVTSQVIYGAAVTVLQEHGAWWRIRTADGYEGFARDRDFLPWSQSPLARQARVRQLSANLYRTPDVKAAAPVLNVPFEARLDVVGEVETWLMVRLVDGSEVYVQSGDVSFADELLSFDAMLAMAHRFLGITYTWGGTSTYGFDCSGYVQMLFRQAGFALPRDAQMQVDWSGFMPVARGALEPADVLFFGEALDAVTHVGVYLGQDRFIHATTESWPGVQIGRLTEQPWTTRLIAQRRLWR